MRTYFFKNFVMIEAENLSGAEIKEHEKRFGELKAVSDSKVGFVLSYGESSMNGKEARNQFLQDLRNHKYRLIKGMENENLKHTKEA